MNNLYLIVPLIITLELIKILKINTFLRSYLAILRKIFFLTKLKKTSDHWKQKLILRYAKKLFYFFLKLLLFLFLVFSPFIVAVLIGQFIFKDILSPFYDYNFYLLSIVFAIIYLKIKNKFYGK